MSEKCLIDRQKQLKQRRAATLAEQRQKQRKLASHEYRPAPWLRNG